MAFFNPPFVAVLFAPLSALPVETFATVLFALVLACVVAGGVLIERGLFRLEARHRLIFWALYITLYTSVWLVLQEQVTVLVLLGWIGFALCQIRGKEKLSGIALAAALVKPDMVVLPVALLIWKRRFGALRAF